MRGKMSLPNKKYNSGSVFDIKELDQISNVEPVIDLDELSSLWPGDDDPDALMNFILSERKARRNSMNKGLP